MSKNTEFAEKLAELVVREAQLRSGRTDGYIRPGIVRAVWQEHLDEVEMESISAKFPDNPDQRRLAEGAGLRDFLQREGRRGGPRKNCVSPHSSTTV